MYCILACNSWRRAAAWQNVFVTSCILLSCLKTYMPSSPSSGRCCWWHSAGACWLIPHPDVEVKRIIILMIQNGRINLIRAWGTAMLILLTQNHSDFIITVECNSSLGFRFNNISSRLCSLSCRHSSLSFRLCHGWLTYRGLFNPCRFFHARTGLLHGRLLVLPTTDLS